MNAPEYYTVPEVAEILRLKRSHTYKLIRQGVIPSVRLGRFIRVPADKLPGQEDLQ